MTPEFWEIISEVSTDGVWLPKLWVVICEGDANAAILFAQILYWRRKMGGEFYKRHGGDGDGWEDDTGLSHDQSRRAQRKLEKLGFIATRIGHGHDHKKATFYSINQEQVMKAIRRYRRLQTAI